MTARDFIYIDDVCEAFLDTAAGLEPHLYGESFNVGSGKQTRIGELAEVARQLYGIAEEPVFSMSGRSWDLKEWYGNIDKI